METLAAHTKTKIISQSSQPWLLWFSFALILLIAPHIFHKGASLSVLSQMGITMIFSLSYNMLLGQGGMLSFGHAVYSGMGAFLAIHALALTGKGSVPIPVTLIPLVGGVAGLFFGALFGYVSTKRAETTFSMITLGIGELLFASSLLFSGFFGGEGGISANRVVGKPIFGVSYAPQSQVYYLIAFWLLVSAIAMYAFTQTPLGRIINAVRDNPERAQFIGYNPRWVRYLTLILSAFFAGIAGGLSAIHFEIVSSEYVSAHQSGIVLLYTFIGGHGAFFGPILGSIVGVFLTVVLSDFTKAWQLYLGLFFIVMVMFAPGGLASLVLMLMRVAKYGRIKRIASSLAIVCIGFAVGFLGIVLVIEMLYHRTLNAAQGPLMKLFGLATNIASATPWLIALSCFICGLLTLLRFLPWYLQVWGQVNAEIETIIKRAES